MRDTRFEQLVLLIGGAAILGALALSYASGPPESAEAVAQIMLFGVLAAAVKLGRKGGLIAAYYGKKLGGWRRTRAVVTLGTPHRGTPLAWLGSPKYESDTRWVEVGA